MDLVVQTRNTLQPKWSFKMSKVTTIIYIMAPIDQANDLALLISLHQEGHHLIKGHYTSKLISYVCLKHSTLRPINEAAKAGDLALLISLRQEGHKWNATTMAYAASDGQLDCLRYLREHGCHLDKWVTANAAAGGHLECLKYLRKNGCEWDNCSPSWAA